MAIDMAATLAKLRAQRAAQAEQVAEVKDAQSQVQEIKEQTVPSPTPIQATVQAITEHVQARQEQPATSTTVVIKEPQAIGTSRTSEIDHLAFMDKMGELKDALLNQHPRMPVLLMTIHKQLREDPELVGTLSEEEIAVIVNSLKVQTKTELTGTIVKQTKSRDKKTKLDVDMF